MTGIAHFFRNTLYLCFWSAVLLAALTVHSQSAELLRSYWLGENLNPAHLVILVIALLYAACVFGASAMPVYGSSLEATHAPPKWVQGAAPSLPVIILLVASIVGLYSWSDVGEVSQWLTLSIAAAVLALIGLVAAMVWVELRGTPPLSVRVRWFFSEAIVRVILDIVTCALLAMFLAAPLLDPASFVNIAVTVGALPSVLFSLMLIMYALHRVFRFQLSPLGTRIALCVLIVTLAGLSAKAIASDSLWLATLAIGGLVAAAWECVRSEPSYRLTITVWLMAVGVLVGFGDISSTTKVRTLGSPSQPLPVASSAFEEWLNSRVDLDDYKRADGTPAPYPVFIVAAQGGGLYAAYHAAMVLSHMQDRCPRFAQHIFAISGVSGGSLGSAVFASAVDRLAPTQSRAPCDLEVSRTDIRKYAETFLKRDFLSPLVFMSVIPNLAQRALSVMPEWLLRQIVTDVGVYDRARGLELGFEIAAINSGSGSGVKSFFEKGVSSVWNPKGVAPALLLNTTRADTGEPYWIAPFRLHTYEKKLDGLEVEDIDFRQKVLAVENPTIDIRISTAAGLSARFPFVTPPGTLDVAGRRWLEKQPRLVDDKFQRVGFVDGGYVENSGLESTWRLALALKEERDKTKATRPVEIVIVPVGDLGGFRYAHFRQQFLPEMGTQWFPEAYADRLPQNDLRWAPASELLAPLKALDASRQYRAWYGLLGIGAITRQSRRKGEPTELSVAGGFFGLSAETNPLPLGWRLSSQTFGRIRARQYVRPGQRHTNCGSLAAKGAFEAEMDKLRQRGEDVGAYTDSLMYACSAESIRNLLSPNT